MDQANGHCYDNGLSFEKIEKDYFLTVYSLCRESVFHILWIILIGASEFIPFVNIDIDLNNNLMNDFNFDLCPTQYINDPV